MPANRREGDPVFLPHGRQYPRDGVSGLPKPQKVPSQRGFLDRSQPFSAAAVFPNRPPGGRAGQDQFMERGRPIGLLERGLGRSGSPGLFRGSGFRPDLPPVPFEIGPDPGRLSTLGAEEFARALCGNKRHHGFAAAPAGDGDSWTGGVAQFTFPSAEGVILERGLRTLQLRKCLRGNGIRAGPLSFVDLDGVSGGSPFPAAAGSHPGHRDIASSADAASAIQPLAQRCSRRGPSW